VTCALYAKEKGLLETDGWKRFKNIAKNDKKLERMLNHSKLKSIKQSPKYKFGYQVPRNSRDATELDKRSGTTRWKDAQAVELAQLMDYETFENKGRSHKGTRAPEDYKRIVCHFIYDVKNDGRHKARLVAGGHLTEVPTDSVYSGVVSLRSLRLVMFLAELNEMEHYQADVGNAYLEACTKEKVYCIGMEDFGKDLNGSVLIIRKALYGLRSSGARWHERFSDTLREMKFTPSKADSDVWMRKGANEDHWEYIAVYVDDLYVASKRPKEILDSLKSKYKLKGDEKLTII
jgi:hypothetical protein